ncbi:MAG TPA: response regulator transcription factor, partial [Kofleriaceae bacterium]
QVLRVGELVIDPGRLTVMLGDEAISCTSREFALLHALALRPGRIVTRDELLGLATGANEPAFSRSIDVMVSKLRTKLHDDSRNPQILKTVRRNGYLLSEAPGNLPDRTSPGELPDQKDRISRDTTDEERHRMDGGLR